MTDISVAALASYKGPADLPKIAEKVKNLSEALGAAHPSFFELCRFKSEYGGLAIFQWAVENGLTPAGVKTLQEKVTRGEVELLLGKDGIELKKVPLEAQEAQRQKVFDRIPLEETPAEYLKEVYVQEIKVENLGGNKLRFVAIREGKEVGNITVREEKDGGLFLGFADTPKAHQGKGVFETLLAEATGGK